MRKWIPWIVLGLAALYALAGFSRPKYSTDFDWVAVGELPVLQGGRLKPLDTVARNALLTFRGKQTLRSAEGKTSALEWLLRVLADPSRADKDKVFVIHDPDVLGLLGFQMKDKYFSFEDLGPHLERIRDQAERASRIESRERSRFQGAVLNLHERLMSYQMLRHTIQDPQSASFTSDIKAFLVQLATGREALRASKGNLSGDNPAIAALAGSFSRFQFMAQAGYFRFLPPLPGEGQEQWRNMGEGLLVSLTSGKIHPLAEHYAALVEAFRKNDKAGFGTELGAIRGYLATDQSGLLRQMGNEFIFNQSAPFYRGMVLYVTAFLLVCVSWLRWTEPLGRSAYRVLLVAFAVHTAGLIARIVLQGRPPVTNLYSSAVFVGWAAVLMAVVIEALFRRGFALAAAAVTGFVTLIIAHHLSSTGDTMEMMRAVLDSNFWLGTHVVTITIGYSATFLAGGLAHIYILRGVFSRTFSADAAKSVAQMVYGVVCFSLLFTFVGTVLGGIWADQSWGRFWGWDPKENGALLIVLWDAIALHARSGNLVGEKGFMVMAVFGNIITAISWFGVNMLGIGLHSYGFMDAALFWLVAFILVQWAVMFVGSLPDRQWRSALGTGR
ncbi:MAG TPA: cytochrome c biogenesis protein CcsA [Verrucomicrobiae bacterium]|nr:cytochrome c biogenesis protein CcsA [Verrucomicrobiae bacterium]